MVEGTSARDIHADHSEHMDSDEPIARFEAERGARPAAQPEAAPVERRVAEAPVKPRIRSAPGRRRASSRRGAGRCGAGTRRGTSEAKARPGAPDPVRCPAGRAGDRRLRLRHGRADHVDRQRLCGGSVSRRVHGRVGHRGGHRGARERARQERSGAVPPQGRFVSHRPRRRAGPARHRAQPGPHASGQLQAVADADRTGQGRPSLLRDGVQAAAGPHVQRRRFQGDLRPGPARPRGHAPEGGGGPGAGSGHAGPARQ